MGARVHVFPSPDCQVLTQSENVEMSQQDQIKGLETQTQNIRERLSNLEGRLASPDKTKQSTHPLLVVLLSVVGSGVLGYWGWLGGQVVQQGKDIKILQTILSPQVIQAASQHPESARSAKQVEYLMTVAINEKKKIDPSLVSDAGKKFLQASTQNPEAWRAALRVLDYKSALNVDAPSLPPSDNSGEFTTQYFQFTVANQPAPKLSFWGVVPKSEAAALNPIGADLNKKLTQGNALLIDEGGVVRLDKMEEKNVIYKGVEVHYSGGPLMLTNVYFVNCKFVMDSTPKSIDLAQAILSSETSTSYASGE